MKMEKFILNYNGASSTKLDGIINYFEKTYGHSHLFQIVSASASSVFNMRGMSEYVIDPTVKSTESIKNFLSDNEDKPNLTISFTYHAVKLTSYSIRSRLDVNYHHPAEWVLEGADSSLNWHQLHYHARNNDFNGVGIEKNFAVNTDKFYNNFRITHFGANLQTNSDCPKCLSMNKIDFFGVVIPQHCRSCANKRKILNSILCASFTINEMKD